MCWPVITSEVADLGWALRYQPIASLYCENALTLASIVDAYIQLVGDTQAKRNHVCKVIRDVSRGKGPS
jgi:hypothetical protein